MPIESAAYVNQLISTWPPGTDDRSTADDHFRLIKQALTQSFPAIGGEVSASHGELNLLRSASWNIQRQLNALKGIFDSASVSGTVHYALSAGKVAYIRPGTDLGTLSGTLNLAPMSHQYFSVVLGGAITSISIGAATTHGETMSVRFQQSGVGGATVGGWPANVVWADGSIYAASATASAIDFVTLAWDAPLSAWLAASRKYG